MTQVAQMTSFQSGSRQLEGYLARPEGDGPFPGIVVIHEIFGLNDNMKDITRRFADQGYVALAVDLFAGRNRALCMFRVMSGLLLNSLDNRSIHDLKAALSFLSGQRRRQFGRARFRELGRWLAARHERRCRSDVLRPDRQHVDRHFSQERRRARRGVQLRHVDESGKFRQRLQRQ